MGLMDGKRDAIGWLVVLFLIVIGVLSFMGLQPTWIIYVAAVTFLIGGMIGIFDAFSVMSTPLKTAYIILFVIVILMGLNIFFPLPLIGGVFSAIPISITHYIINLILVILMIAVIATSD